MAYVDRDRWLLEQAVLLAQGALAGGCIADANPAFIGDYVAELKKAISPLAGGHPGDGCSYDVGVVPYVDGDHA